MLIASRKFKFLFLLFLGMLSNCPVHSCIPVVIFLPYQGPPTNHFIHVIFFHVYILCVSLFMFYDSVLSYTFSLHLCETVWAQFGVAEQLCRCINTFTHINNYIFTIHTFTHPLGTHLINININAACWQLTHSFAP